jgi:hypothetical protein
VNCLCGVPWLFRCESPFPAISHSYGEFITAGTAVRYVLDFARDRSFRMFVPVGIRAVLALPLKVYVKWSISGKIDRRKNRSS